MANTAIVYDRQYGDKTLNFEPSGGLLNSSLVMRDQETDSWWSIMSGTAIGGEEKGTQLKELRLGEKTTWAQWVHRHPDTLVLSIDGKKDDESDKWSFRDGEHLYSIDDHASDEERDVILQGLAAMTNVKRLGGFDTFWYTWIAVHPKTKILP